MAVLRPRPVPAPLQLHEPVQLRLVPPPRHEPVRLLPVLQHLREARRPRELRLDRRHHQERGLA